MLVHAQGLRVDGQREPHPVTPTTATTTTQARPDTVAIAAPGGRLKCPVASPEQAAPVSIALADLEGRSAFLRVVRHDGRCEVVAGRIDAVQENVLLIGEFDVDAAQRLARTGDSFFVSRKRQDGKAALTIASGDTVTMVLDLPVDIPATARVRERRAELRGSAQAIADGQLQALADLSPPEGLGLSAEAAKAVKVEQNAIIMALSGELTQRFVEAAGRLSLTDAAEAGQPLRAMEQALVELAGAVTRTFTRKLSKAPDTPQGRAYARLVEVHRFAQAHVGSSVASSSVTQMLLQGLITPMEVLANLTEVAQHFAPRLGVSAATLMRSSLPLILRLAGTHLSVFQAFFAELQRGATREGSWNPEHFLVSDRNGGLRLELSPALLEAAAKCRGVRFDALPFGTTGCPAAQSLGLANNPVREVVEAFATLVERLDA